MRARVEIHKEVSTAPDANRWRLCFQRVTYHYDPTGTEDGYRFIWRTDQGHLQPARGQARIPDGATLDNLIRQARAEGWLK
jgi:hypothetical protein